MKPPHPNRAMLLTCECTGREREVIEEMKTRATVRADSNLVRLALWAYARHLDVVIDPGVFALRGRGGRGARQ